MDLLSLLNNGATGLAAHRAATATASHNLQNVNTPGYSRQRADITAVQPGEFIGGAFVGRGATLVAIHQMRDRYVETQLPGAFAAAARSGAESRTLASVAALNPDAAAGMTQGLDGFYGALRAAAQNPGDVGLRQAVVSAAQSLTVSFNRTAEGLDAARDGVDATVAGTLPQVNALSEQMADLNQKIAVARNTGAEPNDLLDARQRVQDQLSQLTGATPAPGGNGDVNMMLPGGVSLVAGTRVATLVALPDPANRGHLAVTVSGSNAGPGDKAVALGGELGGLLDARDGALRQAETSLDTLAFDLAGALNAVHQTGVALDGTGGRDLLVPGATAEGAASRLAVSADVKANPRLLATGTTSATGDASVLQQLVATERTPLSTGAAAAGALSTLVAQFGTAASRIAAVADHDAGLQDSLEGAREAASGVSIDEELINLTRAQRAFEAASKVIKTVDEMLETLISLK